MSWDSAIDWIQQGRYARQAERQDGQITTVIMRREGAPADDQHSGGAEFAEILCDSHGPQTMRIVGYESSDLVEGSSAA